MTTSLYAADVKVKWKLGNILSLFVSSIKQFVVSFQNLNF